MQPKQSVRLGPVQETLLIPLYARAVDSRAKHPILEDPKAVEIVEAIDWDFPRFGQSRRVLGCVLRSAMFDQWVKDFIRRHPAGTVVEIGAGLNARFERLDNGSIHWFDLDLPDTIALRRQFFTGSERHSAVAASISEPDWIASVQASPGPYFFVAETVFLYFEEPQVRQALSLIAANFPQAEIAFDTAGRRAIIRGNRDFEKQKLPARFAWACEDPRQLEGWNLGLHLLEARTIVNVHEALRPRLSVSVRASFWLFQKLFRRLIRVYQLAVFSISRDLAEPAAPAAPLRIS